MADQITNDDLAPALSQALHECAIQNGLGLAPDLFRLLTVEHPSTAYRDAPHAERTMFGIVTRRHPEAALRTSTRATWTSDGGFRLDATVAFDTEFEPFSSEPKTTPWFCVSWSLERTTTQKGSAPLA